MKAALIRRALPRAAIHAAVGIVVLICLYLLPRPVFLILLCVGTIGILTLDLVRLRLPVLGERLYTFFAPVLRGGEASRITGATYFLIGSLVSVLAFPRDIAILAILFLSLGDSSAAIIGIWKGRVRLWGKSLEGDAACLVVCLAISLLFASISGRPALTVALVGAVFAAIFQALPLPINDNLTIPIGSGLAMLAANSLVI